MMWSHYEWLQLSGGEPVGDRLEREPTPHGRKRPETGSPQAAQPRRAAWMGVRRASFTGSASGTTVRSATGAPSPVASSSKEEQGNGIIAAHREGLLKLAAGVEASGETPSTSVAAQGVDEAALSDRLAVSPHPAAPHPAPFQTALSRITPHSPLFPPHSSLLTPLSSLVAPHSSLLLLPPHSSLLTHHSSRLTPHSSLLAHRASLITHHSSRITHHSSLLAPHC